MSPSDQGLQSYACIRLQPQVHGRVRLQPQVCVRRHTPLDEAVEEVGVGEQPQRVARGRRVDDHTVEVHAELVTTRQPHELGQGHELIDA